MLCPEKTKIKRTSQRIFLFFFSSLVLIFVLPYLAPKIERKKIKNQKTEKEHAVVFFPRFSSRLFLSSFLHRELGETNLEVPISSPKNAKKKSKTKKSKKKTRWRIFPFFFISLTLIFIFLIGI